MNDVRSFVCEYCHKEFVPNYVVSKKRTLHYCSKSCKTKAQIVEQKKYSFYNKDTLEFAIMQLIKNEKRYLTHFEIMKKLHVSSKTLNKFKVSIVSLNKKCGYKKPKSKFEESVYEYLVDIFGVGNIERQKTFDGCVSPKGNDLFFDFYIQNKNLIIEADGDQHFNQKNHWYSEYYSEECDNVKNDFCQLSKIDLIRIPYQRTIDKAYINHFIQDTYDNLTTT